MLVIFRQQKPFWAPDISWWSTPWCGEGCRWFEADECSVWSSGTARRGWAGQNSRLACSTLDRPACSGSSVGRQSYTARRTPGHRSYTGIKWIKGKLLLLTFTTWRSQPFWSRECACRPDTLSPSHSWPRPGGGDCSRNSQYISSLCSSGRDRSSPAPPWRDSPGRPGCSVRGGGSGGRWGSGEETSHNLTTQCHNNATMSECQMWCLLSAGQSWFDIAVTVQDLPGVAPSLSLLPPVILSSNIQHLTFHTINQPQPPVIISPGQADLVFNNLWCWCKFYFQCNLILYFFSQLN